MKVQDRIEILSKATGINWSILDRHNYYIRVANIAVEFQWHKNNCHMVLKKYPNEELLLENDCQQDRLINKEGKFFWEAVGNLAAEWIKYGFKVGL